MSQVDDPLEPCSDRRRDLANEIRGLIRRCASNRLDVEAIEQVTDLLRHANQLLGASDTPESPRFPRFRLGDDVDLKAIFPSSPASGPANACSPPADFEVVGGEVHGTVVCDSRFEGPPGCVHGGVIALLFDELLGGTNIVNGTPGMTGTLTVVYKSPTPLYKPLSMVARVEREEGRKIFVTGEIVYEGQVTAQASGIFLRIFPFGV